MTQSENFTTGDGRAIRFIAGYYDSRRAWPLGARDYPAFVAQHLAPQTGKSQETHGYPTDPTFYIPKVFGAVGVARLLEECGRKACPGARLLDVATGPSVLPRVLKLLGVCDHTVGVDLTDRHGYFSDDDLRWTVGRYATAVEDLGRIPRPHSVHGDSLINDLFYPPYQLFVSDANRNMSLDRFIQSDFMAWDARGERYEMITTNTGLLYFDVEAYFAKISDLLTPGGWHYLTDTNFYHHHGDCLELPMDAPWMHARMTRDDFIRYVDTCRPEIADAVRTGYRSTTAHMAVVDIIAAGERHGLQCRGFRRGYTDVKDIWIGTKGLAYYAATQALDDCRRINPNVVIDDLLSRTWTVVFEKRR